MNEDRDYIFCKALSESGDTEPGTSDTRFIGFEASTALYFVQVRMESAPRRKLSSNAILFQRIDKDGNPIGTAEKHPLTCRGKTEYETVVGPYKPYSSTTQFRNLKGSRLRISFERKTRAGECQFFIAQSGVS